MVAPNLTETQRQFGASVSLRVRQARAGLKYGVSQGTIPFGAALEFTVAQGMRVKSLLMALPGIGPARAARILESAGLVAGWEAMLEQLNPRERVATILRVAGNRSVRSLGPKQRERLLALLSRSA